MSRWEAMLAELGDVPDLPGARCRGRAQLFDATIAPNRGAPPRKVEIARQAAADVCAQCPALHTCNTWLHSLPDDQRPTGVVAGQVVTPSELSLFQRARAKRAEQFAALRQTGMSLRAIANATGASASDVRRLLARRDT